MSSDELRTGKLVQLLPDWELNQSMPLYAVYPRRKFLAKKVHIFMEFVRHHINAEKIDNV
jgi:DNA-binding transcriptional LysR family regulator